MRVEDLTLKQIVDLLKRRGLSQASIARKAGISPVVVSRIAGGVGEGTSYTNVRPLLRLASQVIEEKQYFGVPAAHGRVMERRREAA